MLFVAGLVLFLCYSAQCEHLFDVFDVKPEDKDLYYQKKWHKYKCTFVYHARGQTKEQWRIIMEKVTEDTYLKCTIFITESYLTFDNFTMSLTGPGVDLVKHDATSISEVSLKYSETTLDRAKKTVSSVDGKFLKRLARVILIAKLTKEARTEL
ncbi:hypothetical protein ACOMHN_015562 [Nucella lapillus]